MQNLLCIGNYAGKVIGAVENTKQNGHFLVTDE